MRNYVATQARSDLEAIDLSKLMISSDRRELDDLVEVR
jgi:hypothetical protein